MNWDSILTLANIYKLIQPFQDNFETFTNFSANLYIPPFKVGNPMITASSLQHRLNRPSMHQQPHAVAVAGARYVDIVAHSLKHAAHEKTSTSSE